LYNTSLIGSMWKLTCPMLGAEVGEVGYCFSEYQDFDEPSKTSVQIIFKNGNYDGFSVEEQGLYLEHVGYKPEYQNYVFRNVMRVHKDWSAGYWKW